MLEPKFMDQLVEFIQDSKFEDLPKELILEAKYAMIDTVGVTLAGWNEPVVSKLKKVYLAIEGPKMATLLGENKRALLNDVVLINGAASHALDYDDVAPSILAHPSVAILSAIIPLAEYLQCSGKEAITAYIIGTEIMIKLGNIMGFRHYDLSWHATDTLGTIGAAASSAYLLKLDKQKTANAIAIAASMAGGLQKNFGTMTKPLHVGLSNYHGIQATFLAQEGLTANPDIFEERGFFFAFTGGQESHHYHTKKNNIHFGKPYSLIEAPLSVKKFPCCYCTHRIIQGGLELRNERGLKLKDIIAVEILSPKGGLTPLIHHHPLTGLQAKFSAEYTLLAAIEDGHVGLLSFEDKQVLRPSIQRNLSKVETKEMEGGISSGDDLDLQPLQIKVKTVDKELVKEILYTPGSKESPLSEKDRRIKWYDCLQYWRSQYGITINENLINKANLLFDHGLKMEAYESFDEWIKEIHDLETI